MSKSYLSVRTKIFLASVAAISLSALLFTAYTISTRTSDLEKNIELMAQTRATFASHDAGLAMYSEDQAALLEHIEQALTLNGTEGVMFLDRNSNTLAVSGGFLYPETPITEIIGQRFVQEKLYYYAQPVMLSGIDLFDYQTEFQQQNDQNAGWVIVALDTSEQQQQLKAIIISALIIALIASLSAMAATFWVSLMIVTPIKALTETVLRIKEGNLLSRAPSTFTTRELAILSEGINSMAETVQEGTLYLESRVDQATAQLNKTLNDLQQKNSDLEAAREDAEQANQSKSDFLARMSHELRTPLTSIQGFSRLLNESAINEADKQHCRVIDQAANQLLMLIDDILDFSKLQSNTVVLENEPYNVIDCVEQVVSLFAQAAHEKGLELILNFSPTLTLIRRGDQKRVRQIINNLVSNALKFTPSGGVYIDVAENTVDPNSLLIQVRDTGIGIKESNRNQLFRAFSQADTSISRQYGGTGLGLSIIKSLVDAMKGTLTFKSKLGTGTEFTADIPAPRITRSQAAEKLNLTTLVYHDSKAAFQSIKNLLYRVGCNAIDASNNTIDDTAVHHAVIYRLSTNAHMDADFPAPLLAVRQQHPSSHLIALTPVTNLHNLLSQDELRQLQPASFIPNPPTLTALNRVIENTLIDSPSFEQIHDKTPLLNGLNILIAEDNQFTCLLLETLVEKHGATFSTATNGHEAVKVSKKEPFDVILIDVHMPELNGIEAIKQIRRGQGANTETPIIALTADLLQQEEKELFTVGANEMLLKPFNENHLLEKIRYKSGITSAINQNLEGLDHLVDDQLFIAELHALTDTAKIHLGNSDWQLARDVIHQMLGITGVFNLAELDSKVIELHETIKKENFDLLPALLNDITDMLERLTAEKTVQA